MRLQIAGSRVRITLGSRFLALRLKIPGLHCRLPTGSVTVTFVQMAERQTAVTSTHAGKDVREYVMSTINILPHSVSTTWQAGYKYAIQ